MDWRNWSSLVPTKYPFTAGWLESIASTDAEAIKGTFIALVWLSFLIGLLIVVIQTSLAWWYKQRPYILVLKSSASYEGVMKSSLPWFIEFRRHLVDAPAIDGTERIIKKRTVDATEVMPENVLAPAFISNRLILAMPSIMTGLGVLGTFTGLALGMSKIDLGSSLTNLTTAIQPMISTFAGAFSCSVWGVLASLVFSFLEKLLETFSLWKIGELHNRLNALYPRYIPEEALVEISDHGRQTSEILKGLAVAIGDHMQKAIGKLGQEIKEAVATATMEGQGPLAEKSAQLLEKAITTELINLKNQIDGMAEKFSASFDGASSNLLKSIEGFEPTVHSLSSTVNSVQSAVTNAVEKLNSHESVMTEMASAATKIHEAASSFESMRDALENSAERNREAATAQNIASNTNIKVSQEFEKIGLGLAGIQETIKQGAEVIGSLGSPIRELQTLLASQPELQKQIDQERQSTEETRNRRILEMSAGLAEKVGEAATQFAQVGQLAEQLATAAASLDQASAKLSEFGEHITEASVEQSKASEMSRTAAMASERTAKALEPIPETISNLTSGLEAAGEKVKDGAEAAKESYEQLIVIQKQWFDGAERGLRVMKESLEEVFETYGQQVQGQTGALMTQWTEKVDECLQSYETQLQQMIGGIDEIQTAIDKLKRQ